MVKPFPSETHIGNHALHPETQMLNYGYDPQLSEGAVKPRLSDVHLRLQDCGGRTGLLRLRLRPSRAARGDGCRPCLFAVQPSQ